MQNPKTAQVVADAAVGASVTAASWTWVAQANDILQLIATLVAIGAGGSATYFHITRAKQLKANKGGN